VSGVGAVSITADSDGNADGDLLLDAAVDSSITVASAGVTQVVLSGHDFALNTAVTSFVDGATAAVVVEQSVASGASNGSITVGGTGTAVTAGDLVIDQTELSKITTTSTLTIGGSTTALVSVNSAAYSTSSPYGPATALELWALGGSGGTSGSVQFIAGGAGSSSNALTTSVRAADTITFANGLSTTGSGGLVLRADDACTGLTGGTLTVDDSVVVTTNGYPMVVTAGEVSLVLGSGVRGSLRAVLSSMAIGTECGGLEIGGLSDSPVTSGDIMLSANELAAIGAGTLTLSPAAASGAITVYAIPTTASTAGITGLISLDDSSRLGGVHFTAATTFASWLAATTAGFIVIDSSANITTNTGPLTLTSSNSSTAATTITVTTQPLT